MKIHTSSQKSFVPSLLYEIAAQIAISRQITSSERSILRKAFLENSLSEEEHQLINRIHRALLRGYIKLI